MHKLLAALTEFYRWNSESWLERFQYKEACHQLLLMAFLQRIRRELHVVDDKEIVLLGM